METSQTTNKDNLYYVALARGADFRVLKARGFTVFYPLLDDYVFLEVSDDNKKLLNKQEELCVKFLRDKSGKGIQTVTGKELNRMTQTTQKSLVPGQDITVVDGSFIGMDGKITSLEGDNITCKVVGYRKTYQVILTAVQIVKRGTELPSIEGEIENE